MDLNKNLISCIILILSCSHVNLDEKIWGGQNIHISDAPYTMQVHILVKNQHLRCGGSLVHANFVVTAAHCVAATPRRISVWGGANDWIEDVNLGHIPYDPQLGVLRLVSSIAISEFYDPETFFMDVAVLQLQQPMFGDFISTIGLCETPWSIGDQVLVTGWGATHYNLLGSQELQGVYVPIADSDLCFRTLGSIYHFFCAGSPGRDRAMGDTGGPAMFMRRLVGIVSTGTKDGARVQLGGYTDVCGTPVKNFILSTVRDSSRKKQLEKTKRFLLSRIWR